MVKNHALSGRGFSSVWGTRATFRKKSLRFSVKFAQVYKKILSALFCLTKRRNHNILYLV